MKTKYCFFILMAAFILPASLAAGNIEFVGPFNYATGTDPVYVMASDFDNDGDNDLSVMNFHSENMSLLFNTGTGNFAPQVKYNIGTLPRSLYNSDLDGDDDIDIIVVDLSLDSVFVMKNNGSGLFTVAGSYTADNGPAAIAAADYDDDGDNDLAIANWSSANISILMNDGNGTFGDPINYDSEMGPGCIVSSDFDSDGDPDLAVTNWYANSVTVYENDGTGNFAPAISYTVNQPRQIGLADFNGDGYGDMAVADDSSDVMTIFLFNNNFAFTNSGSYDAGAGPRSVNAADLDGDGDPDLAVANYDIDSISILINDGNAEFSRALSYGAGEGPYYITISDLDNDTDYDLAVTNHDDNNLSVFLNECFGEVIHVPGDQPTIQAGIDYAVPGDTVLVADGTYTGEGNRDIDFHGKNIVLMSENGSEATIIDCGGMARGFYFHSGEDTTSVVQGFTITGGLAVEGGGIYISNSGPKIVGNVISGNAAGVPDWNGTLYGGFGAGIYCAGNSTPLIDSNRISGNHFDWEGQGTAIYCDSSNPIITNNIISNNSQSCHSKYGGLVVIQSNLVFRGNIVSDNFSWSGGPVEFHNSSVEFAENIVRDNFNLENGGAISCTGSQLIMTNSIILNNLVAWQPSGCNMKSLSEAWRRSEQYPGIRRALAILDTISIIPEISVATPKQTEITYGTTSAATVTNCIFWGNSQPEVNIVDADELSVRFSVVRDGWPGEGNLDVDPIFVDPSSGDLTVCAESPCIDAGDPAISDPDNSPSDIGLFQTDHPDCNPGTVWHVAADGNYLHGDGSAAAPFQTIQDAVDTAHSGDTVLVERGTYNETVDIYVKGPVITSQYIYTGDSADITETVIISAQDSSSVRSWGNGSLCKLTGFTITSEQSTQYHFPGVICAGSGIHISDNIIARTCGRGIAVGYSSNPIIEANIIDSNRCAIELNSRSSGQIKNNTIIRNYSGHVPEAGINCWDSDPAIEGNTIYDNGGGIYLYYTPVIEIKGNVIFGNDYGVVIAGGADAVFDGNTIAANGTGISVEYTSQITINNCIISYQLGSGLAVCKHDLDLSIMNTDIYNNANGDWIDCFADQADINGNFSADPLFCDTASGNYYLSGYSPCAPANSESGELIGALGVGCDFEFTQIYFDIKPGSCPNPINIKLKENGKAVIPAAILGTEDFDVHDIDVGSLTLMGVSPIRYNYDDVSAPAETDDSCDCSEDGPDGYEDLTLKFNRQALVTALIQQPLVETMTLIISGQLIDSTSIEGSDCVVIRPNIYGEIVGLDSDGESIIVISGDVSGDNQVNLVDVAFMIEFLYRDGNNAAFTVEAADVNGTQTVNILDITYLIAYLYKEGPDPACQ